jgi:hypothetical protein
MSLGDQPRRLRKEGWQRIESWQKKWALLVAKAWTDESFKQQLVSRPNEILEEYGVELPQGVEIRVVENTDEVEYLPLPAKPSTQNIAQMALDPCGRCCC